MRLAKEKGGSRKRLCTGAFVSGAAGEDALDARTPMDLLPSLPSRRGTGRISMETLGRAVVSQLTHDGCRAPEVKDFICASARSAGWSVRRARSTLAGLNLVRRRWSKASGRTGGRPKGWRRVSDEELLQRLQPYTWESGWNPKLGRPRMVLLGSKSSVARSIGMPARTLSRHLARARLGVYAAKQRSGKCQYCHQWDTHEEKLLSKLLQQLRTRIEGMHGDFWVRFDRNSAVDEEF